MAGTWSAVRFGEREGELRRLGWCGHRHRIEDQAVACCRRLNRSWGHTGESWSVLPEGHRAPAPAMGAGAGSSP